MEEEEMNVFEMTYFGKPKPLFHHENMEA